MKSVCEDVYGDDMKRQVNMAWCIYRVAPGEGYGKL